VRPLDVDRVGGGDGSLRTVFEAALLLDRF
jgi:hypothetical protein